MARSVFPDFSLANPVYRGCSVTLYLVEDGEATTTKATLYAEPTGDVLLKNPQVLDADGKFPLPVYVEDPVIAVVSGLHSGDHSTGIFNPLDDVRVYMFQTQAMYLLALAKRAYLSARNAISSMSASVAAAAASASSAATSEANAASSATSAASSAASVATALAAIAQEAPVHITAATTITSAQNGVWVVIETDSASVALTAPPSEEAATGQVDAPFLFTAQRDGTNAATVVPQGTDTINGSTDPYAIDDGQGVKFVLDEQVSPHNWIATPYSGGVSQTDLDALRDVAANAQTTSYTLALSDRGKSVDTTAGVTVPPNSSIAFSVGSVVTITNTSASGITITQGSGVTLRLAGTTSTGNRTLAAYGQATARKADTDTWFISGAGIS